MSPQNTHTHILSIAVQNFINMYTYVSVYAIELKRSTSMGEKNWREKHVETFTTFFERHNSNNNKIEEM